MTATAAYAPLATTVTSTDDAIEGKIDGTTRAPLPAPVDDSLEGKLNTAAPANSASSSSNAAAASSSIFGAIAGIFSSNSSNNSAAPNTAMNNDAGSSMGIDSEMNGLLTQLKSRKWVATLRPVASFAGATSFSKPRTTAEAMARLESNVPFFLTNYLLLCLVVSVITILSKPWLFFVGLVLGAMWVWATRQDEVKIGSVVLQGRNKMIALSSVTGTVLFITAGPTLFAVVGMCATLVIAHGVMHNLPNLDETELDEMPPSLA